MRSYARPWAQASTAMPLPPPQWKSKFQQTNASLGDQGSARDLLEAVLREQPLLAEAV